MRHLINALDKYEEKVRICTVFAKTTCKGGNNEAMRGIILLYVLLVCP